jgi:hypothetical protein
MRKKICYLLLLFCMLFSSCQNNSNNNVFEKYSLYCEYENPFKGLEIYAWKDNDNTWYTVLMLGTNSLKTVEEVAKLQAELPCKIDDMKVILDYYCSKGINEFFVIIVSNPPTEDELINSNNISKKEYNFVLEKLGI